MKKQAYSEVIFSELLSHWKQHLKQIHLYYKDSTCGKKPSCVQKHDKLMELYWKSYGAWKKGDRG